MAGIGFELRKLLAKRSLLGTLQAYAYAGLIGSGPMVLSIIGMVLIGVLSFGVVIPHALITQFQITVTYVYFCSLVFTSPLQLSFTRFVADRLYARDEAAILPNFNGLLLLVLNVSAALALPLAIWAFPEQSVLYRLLFVLAMAIMSGIWIAAVFLSGVKQYKAVLLVFLVGYCATFALALILMHFLSMEGLLLGFVFGHFLLLLGMIWIIYGSYRSDRFIAFDIWRRGVMYPSLMFTGLFFNLGLWIDKLIFWYDPGTGQSVVGPLHASVIYDFPIFLAYLTIIPGMAVFLVRIETDFVEYYGKFFEAASGGATLDHIMRMRNQMVYYVRQGIVDIAKVQAIAALVTFTMGESLLTWMGISTLYLPLLFIDVVGAGIQVVLLGVLNVLFYLDQRRIVLGLTGLMLASNAALSALTLHLGAAWYGYGFALAMLITVLVAVWILDRRLEALEYETFMLQ